MSEEIVVIGGGFAGLAAGVELARQGRRVRLLEQKPHLGGRARSFIDPASGSVVDNGQHLLMGCYRATIRFLETLGTLDRVRFQDKLSVPFLDKGGRLTALATNKLPAPWHLLIGVFRSRSFSFREKFEVARLGRALDSHQGRRVDEDIPPRETVEEWLRRCGQSENLRRNFWDLLCIAAMNEDPRLASAALFARVLRLALFSSPADSRLGIARVGLSDCYTQAAAAYIEARGGSVLCGRRATSLCVAEGACRGVTLAHGDNLEAARVIAAVPWHDLAALLPSELVRGEPFFGAALSLRPTPILSINLWFDRSVTDLEFAGLRGTTIQWLFNKGKILGSGENYLSVVLSGAHQYVERPKADLLEMAVRELGELLPATRAARLEHALVIKERFATFSPSWEAEQVRPPARTPVRGLLLAGDWTATGLPATIEGAVQSGYTAAQAALGTG